jgi:nucleoid-associated protein YgaU
MYPLVFPPRKRKKLMSARKTFRVMCRRPQLSWLLAIAVLSLAAPVYGQSLGDIARQERAREQTGAPPTDTHVYDNDDLVRPQILVPADRDRTQATAQAATPPPTAQPQSPSAPAPEPASKQDDAYFDPNVDPNTLPLGDIARHYRALKAAREQQEAQSAARPPAPAERGRAQAATQPAAPPPSAPAPQPASSQADMYLDPNVDPNTLPLGDIARHYRALKAAAARQQQLAQSAARKTMPAAPPLAYPTFTQPQARPVAPPAPFSVADAPAHHAMPTERPQISMERDVRNISGVTRFRVQSGDTLWVLARKYLGHAKEWLVLAANNPQVTGPTHLRVGTWLRLPGEKTEAHNSLAPGGHAKAGLATERVRVESGDSLWSLSQAHLGDGRAWSCVAQANPGLSNANMIFPGQVLAIPARCAASASPRVRSSAVSAQAFADPALQ